MKTTKNKDAIYREIGRFIFNFSQLEFLIRHSLAAAIDIRHPLFDALISPIDFALLCRVTPVVLIEKLDPKESAKYRIKELFNGCSKINDRRNQIAHGTWSWGEGTEDSVNLRHVSRQSLKDNYYFEHVDEIRAAADEVERLRARSIELLGFIQRSKV
jgi:hypothetical protein